MLDASLTRTHGKHEVTVLVRAARYRKSGILNGDKSVSFLGGTLRDFYASEVLSWILTKLMSNSNRGQGVPNFGTGVMICCASLLAPTCQGRARDQGAITVDAGMKISLT